MKATNKKKENKMKSENQIAAEIESPKEAYDHINRSIFKGNKVQGFSCTYSYVGEIILETVAKKVNGFQADIAEKALGGYGMSNKQKWCVAYAYVKINTNK
jgi:hypothetical protein